MFSKNEENIIFIILVLIFLISKNFFEYIKGIITLLQLYAKSQDSKIKLIIFYLHKVTFLYIFPYM